MYPLSSLNDVSPTSLSDTKDLYGIFAVQACQSSMFLFFWGCMVCTPLINFMFIVNESKVQYKNSTFMTMVRIFCPKKGVMSCIFQITCQGSDS
jgi:hypothetical protein